MHAFTQLIPTANVSEELNSAAEVNGELLLACSTIIKIMLVVTVQSINFRLKISRSTQFRDND